MGTQACALHDRQERRLDLHAEGARSLAKGAEVAFDSPDRLNLVAVRRAALARRRHARRGLEVKPHVGEEVDVALGLAARRRRPDAARGDVAAGEVFVGGGRGVGRGGQASDDVCNRGDEGGVRVHGVLTLKKDGRVRTVREVELGC